MADQTTGKVPRIRFREFSRDWHETTFGELFPITSASRVHKNEWTTSGVPFFRSSDVVSHFKGEKNTKAFISVELYQELSAKVGRIKRGDILVTGGGSIGIPFLVRNDAPLYFKDADLLWFKARESADGNYLYTFFSAAPFRRYLKSISHIGTIAHYTVEQAKGTPITLPTELGEQAKLGAYFCQLDQLIELHQRKYEKLEALKAAMLQKMFPKPGTTAPEVRFRGFSEPWVEKKLKDVGTFNPKEVLPDFFEYVDLESVVGTEMVGHRKETRTTAPSRAQRLARKGDLFFQTVRPYQKNNHLFNLPDENYVFSTGYAQIRPHDDGSFLLSLMQRDDFVREVLANCTGTSYPAITANALSDILVLTPSADEQKKIGAYFFTLDTLIARHAAQVRKLQQIKLACLDEMFI